MKRLGIITMSLLGNSIGLGLVYHFFGFEVAVLIGMANIVATLDELIYFGGKVN